MTKLNFLARLKNEGKIILVEPSEEIKESYIQKAERLFFLRPIQSQKTQ